MRKFTFLAAVALLAAPAYALGGRTATPLTTPVQPGCALHVQGTAPRTGGIPLLTPQRADAPTRAEGEEIITTAPAGTVHDNLVRSSISFDVEFNEAFTDVVECMVGEFVEGNDGYLYVKNPFAFNKTDSYMKLKIEGETAVLEGPQLILQDDIDGSGTLTDLYVMRMKLSEIEVNGTLRKWYIEEEGPIVFDYKDGVLAQRQEPDVIFGLATSEGDWVGFGDWDLIMEPIDEEIVLMPKDADVKKYSLTYFTGGGVVDVAIVDDLVYVAGLNESDPQYCIKGKIEGDKVTFPGGQYTGVIHQAASADMVFDYHTYFMPAKVEQEWFPDYGQYVDVYVLEDNLVCDYYAGNGEIYSSEVVLLNASKSRPYYVEAYENPALVPYKGKVPGVPAKPWVAEFMEIKDWFDDGDVYGGISFVLMPYDTAGNYIDPKDLYYNIVINDEVFTFTPEEFVKLTEPMTDVPYYFADNYDIQISDEIFHNVYFTNPEYTKIGVQAKYTVDGVTNVSEVSYFGDDPTTGVEDVPVDAKVEWTIYTDLAGCRVSNPERGIYIKTVKYSDGTVVNSKVLK